MDRVSNPDNTVGIADLSDAELRDVTYVSRDLLDQGLEIADAVGMDGVEVGLIPHYEEEDVWALVLRNDRDAESGIVVAPRERSED